MKHRIEGSSFVAGMGMIDDLKKKLEGFGQVITEIKIDYRPGRFCYREFIAIVWSKKGTVEK